MSESTEDDEKELWEALSISLGEGVRVAILPNEESPRIAVRAGDAGERWGALTRRAHHHWRGALKKFAIGAQGVLTRGKITPSLNSKARDWSTFVRSFGDDPLRVYIGNVTGARKFVVEYSTKGDRGNAFVKLGLNPGARARIEHELTILQLIPDRLRPRILAYRLEVDFGALVTGELVGRHPGLGIPSRSALRDYVSALSRGPRVPLREHPVVLRLPQDFRRRLGPVLERSQALIPQGLQHGDFVPWNVRVDEAGRVSCIDWEYGLKAGSPLLDIAYWILQCSNIAHRHSPDHARARMERWFVSEEWPQLSESDARAVAAVCMAQAVARAQSELGVGGEGQRRWRERVIESACTT